MSQTSDATGPDLADLARRFGDPAASGVDRERVLELAGKDPQVDIEGLSAGYGKMEAVHDLHLAVGLGQSLCLIGANGAGKSTVLHAIFGFASVRSGRIRVGGRDVTRLAPGEKLRRAGIAYVLQDNSVFPNMSVEENLLMGGFLMDGAEQSREAVERVLGRHPRLAARRTEAAGLLSGGERRLLEIARALIMEPEVLLVDEPSIGLDPLHVDLVFDILGRLRDEEGKTIVMVEQNARRGLEFADLGYVMVSGHVALAGSGRELLADPQVERLFLGG